MDICGVLLDLYGTYLNKLSSDPTGRCEPIFIDISRASF